MAAFSFPNDMMKAGVKGQPAPEPGMGATLLMWSDREPYTVSRVSPGGKTLWAKRDHAKRVDGNGMSESQKYEFTPNPDAHEEMFTLRKNGRWVRKGDSMRGTALALGYRDKYYDFSF